ncbi:MAG: KWG Leptospira [Bacteroidetes bacterium ADurb.Bin217]|nr:MAG: KWG Leptospira [Bacteroidetes bacterium ADurb.Bin217]
MKYVIIIYFLILQINLLAQEEPIPYRKDTLWGFCNINKEILIPYIYTNVDRFYENATTSACINDSCWIITTDGNRINSIPFNEIYKSDKYYFVKINNLEGVVDFEGNTILQTQFEEIRYINKIFYTTRKEINESIIDYKNFIINQNEFYYIKNNDTLIVYTKIPYHLFEEQNDGTYKMITTEDSFGNSYVNGYLYKPEIYNYYYELYNNKGQYIKSGLPPMQFRYGDYIMSYIEGEKWGFMDTLGNIVIPPSYEDAMGFYNNIAAVKKNDKWGFINTKDSIIIPFIFSNVKNFKNNRFWVKNDSAWALIDRNFNQLTEFEFNEVSYFEEGLAYVKKKSDWGFIDTMGNKIIDYKFYLANEFSEGLAFVCSTDSLCGYINKQGEIKVPFIYSYMYGGEFKEGIALVNKIIRDTSLYGCINIKGDVIVPIKYFICCHDFDYFNKGLGRFLISNDDNIRVINYAKVFYFDKNGIFYYEDDNK